MVRPLSAFIAAVICMAGADRAAAQEYPSKLVRIVAPSPGGGGDFEIGRAHV